MLEDGVPQRIVAFRRAAESASGPEAAVPREHKSDDSGQTIKAGSRSPDRTYLICLDTLHSDFTNFVRVRRALGSFFEDEHSGDSQYALIAIGETTHVVVDSTRDPAVILQAIESKSLLGTI